MEDSFDKIDAYLFGQLSGTSLAAFEAEKANNPALAQAVEQHRKEHQALQLLREEALRARMRGWNAGGGTNNASVDNDQPVLKTRGGTRFRLLLSWAAAACFALLAAWLFLRPQPDWPQLAMARYPVWEQSKSAGASPVDTLQQAIDLLQRGDVAGLDLLDQVPPSHPLYGEIPLFKADYYFHKKAFEQVVVLCAPLASSEPNTDNRQKAEWRLALAYLALEGKKDRFQTIFNNILKQGNAHFHAKDAAALQKSLE